MKKRIALLTGALVLLCAAAGWLAGALCSGRFDLLRFAIAAALVIAVCAGAVWVASTSLTRMFSSQLREIEKLLSGDGPARAYPETRALVDDIDARLNKLRHSMAEVERTSRVRHDFVANASHELKSPLTSIKGFAELLASGMGEDRREEYLKRIVAESDRLLAIIEDILLLSEAESSPPKDIAAVDLRKTADEVVRALELSAKAKRISLEAAGSGSTRANAREIWELMYNLVDNGIRYGREGGFVLVKVRPSEFTVVDDGAGIADSEQARIFERFYRVDKSRSRASGGTGLGLSIARHIARKYGGDLEVRSEPGKGSAFTALLPGLAEDEHNDTVGA